VVALHTGLRRGEQFRLRWSEHVFTTGIVTVADSKSGEPRHVPMNDTVRAVLRALPSRLKSAWVFPSETGETPLDAQNFVNRVFLPALRRAKNREFPLARLAPHVRVAARHGRGRSAHGAGAARAQDAGDDVALCTPLAGAPVGGGAAPESPGFRRRKYHR